MALDFGTRRCGLAVTDPLGMFAQGLTTVPPEELIPYIANYNKINPISTLVVGKPTRMDGSDSQVETEIVKFIKAFQKELKEIEVVRFDERFTSKMATQTLIAAGVSRKKRKKKETLDKISATLILQDYLDTQSI